MDGIRDELGTGQPLVLGVTSIGAKVIGPGRIEITAGTAEGTAPTWIGPWNSTCRLEQVSDIATALSEAGLPSEAMADIAPLVWTKLAMACAMNAIAGLTRLNVGCVLDAPAGNTLILQVIEEVVAVGRAAGVRLDLQEVKAKAFEIYEGARDHVPSMAVDIRNGRPTEVGALNEAVAGLAERMGIAASVNRCLAQLIRAGEQAALSPALGA
jgi:2-dehydropantoate 2-reductase